MHTKRMAKARGTVTKRSARWHHRPESTTLPQQISRFHPRCLAQAQAWVYQHLRLSWPMVMALGLWAPCHRRHQTLGCPFPTKPFLLTDLFLLPHPRSTPHPLDSQHARHRLKVDMVARSPSYLLGLDLLGLGPPEVPLSYRQASSLDMAAVDDFRPETLSTPNLEL